MRGFSVLKTLQIMGLLGFVGFSNAYYDMIAETGGSREPRTCAIGMTLVHAHSYYCLDDNQMARAGQMNMLAKASFCSLFILGMWQLIAGSRPP